MNNAHAQDIPASLSRANARLSAVQVLYELELSGTGSDIALADFIERRWNAPDNDTDDAQTAPPDRAYMERVVRGVGARVSELDGMIGPALDSGWDIQRLEVLIRCILRAGAYELLAEKDVPVRVVINEYVNVAHAFFAGGEPGLINGVLDRLAKVLRESELEKNKGGKDT